MRRRLLIGSALLLPTLLVALGIAAHLLLKSFEAPGPLADERVVVVPRGSGLAAIAQKLEEAGVVSNALMFRLGVRIEGAARTLKAGEYSFPAAVSMRGAMELLQSGKTVIRRITFPEGLTSVELIALLNAADGLSGAITEVPAEGALLPDTYHYSLDDPRAAILERMLVGRDEVLAALWPQRAEGLPIATPEEALVLASIVEKETGVADERPLVAGVFVNRLRKGMLLQSDPTVVYGITEGSGPLGRALTRQDLQTPSPYNTYAIKGLPPGPIANPGRAALEAVLNPVETDYLYFVADGSGGHAFARTLDEHNRNVAKWRKLQRQRSQGD
ncbi:MAG: endolytic transglycosylase MltG [Kiloniellales bacterium]